MKDALIRRSPPKAARQALNIVERGFVVARNRSEKSLSPRKTICIHGDTPGAPQIAIAVAANFAPSRPSTSLPLSP